MAVVRLSSSPRLCSSYFVMGESYPQRNRWRAGVCLWPKSLGVELTCRIVGVIPSTLVRTVGPQDTIAPDANPARRVYTRFSVVKPLGVELTRQIVGVIPPALVRTVDPQDTIAPDADPGRWAYKRFSVDLFGSLSLGWVALRVD